MIRDMIRVLKTDPSAVLEDFIGVSAIFVIVLVGLHLPVTL